MRCVVVLAALALAAALFAQDEKQIQDAIKGLGSESFEDREKATADLKKIGAPALEALKKAAEQNDDPEVRARAKRLVEDITKPAPRQSGPGRLPQTTKGSQVVIRQNKDDTVYTLRPPDGDAIEFHRGTEGKVKLVYPDGKGGKAEAEAESIEKFVGDNKELAAKYGITKDGIDYGGAKMSFKSPLTDIPGIWPLDVPVPMPPMRELDDLFKESEELRKAFEDLRRWREVPRDRWGFGVFGLEVVQGAHLGPVPDVLRSQLSIPEGQGVVVESVAPNSTAAAAGLKRYDVILEIDGKKVASPADLRTLLKRDSKARVIRSGKEQDLQPAPAPKKEY